MANPYFRFKQFKVDHDRCAMKVTTDACLFGAWVAAQLREEPAIHRMLDIGTGTGLLSLMAAQQTASLIDAVEIDAEAAAQAGENISASPWKERLAVSHADVRTFTGTEKYDAIISNPPFYESELASSDTKKNLAHHSGALTIRELLQAIGHNLQPHGLFFLLLPSKRWPAVQQLIVEEGFGVREVVTLRPSVQHAPFRVMVKAGRGTTAAVTTEIAVKDEHDQYTTQFTRLLKDYYLYL